MTDSLPRLPDDGADERLRRQMDFLVEMDRLKTILRTALTEGGARRENDAEHSWHVALMAPTLAEYSDREIDVDRVVKMLLVHDLVEIDAGDVMIYHEAARRAQHARELVAAERIFNLLPADQAAELRGLWDEFEALESAEALYAKALDRLQPLLLNYLSRGAPWREHGVTAAQVRRINSSIADASPRLWDFASGLIEDAVKQGWLPE
jgi:putative hydrolase of HD superfamily